MIMQGDSYKLGFTVLNNGGSVVTPDEIIDMEITIGHLKKTYGRSELTYSDGMWMFPFSQKETMSYWPKSVNAQIRIKWANGVVEGKPIYGIRVNEGSSKEVL